MLPWQHMDERRRLHCSGHVLRLRWWVQPSHIHDNYDNEVDDHDVDKHDAAVDGHDADGCRLPGRE